MSLDAVTAIVEQLAELVMLADPGSTKPDAKIEALLRLLAEHLNSAELPADVLSAITDCVEAGGPSSESAEVTDPDVAGRLAAALVKLQSVLIGAERRLAPPEPRFQGGGEPGSGCTPKAFVRDAETIALVGEFLSESEEGLGRADEILMNAEHDGINA